MEKHLRDSIEKVYKKNKYLSGVDISKIVGCSSHHVYNFLRNFRKDDNEYTDELIKLVKNTDELHLEKSVGFKDKGQYFLFTKIAEKELKTEGFKILNSNDFSEKELSWLEKNYNLRCKNRYSF